jgi:hypothetical protein
MCVDDGTRTMLIIPRIYADEFRVHPRSLLHCQRSILSADNYRNPLKLVVDLFHDLTSISLCVLSVSMLRSARPYLLRSGIVAYFRAEYSSIQVVSGFGSRYLFHDQSLKAFHDRLN